MVKGRECLYSRLESTISAQILQQEEKTKHERERTGRFIPWADYREHFLPRLFTPHSLSRFARKKTAQA